MVLQQVDIKMVVQKLILSSGLMKQTVQNSQTLNKFLLQTQADKEFHLQTLQLTENQLHQLQSIVKIKLELSM